MIVESLRKVCPNCLVILGGPEVSFDSASLMEQNPDVDITVRGEGEITFPLLIESIIMNKSLADLDGITFRRNDKIIVNRDRELIKDLDTIPFPYEDGFEGLRKPDNLL